MTKKVLFICPNGNMRRLASMSFEEILNQAGCETKFVIVPAGYILLDDSSGFDLIVVMGEFQFLVEEIEASPAGKTPVIYFDIFQDVRPLKNAKLIDGTRIENVLEHFEKILNVHL